MIVLGLALMSMLTTRERDAAPDLAGFTQATLPVAHRSEPLSVSIWYPVADAVPDTPELIGQNALFYGHHVLRDAEPEPGSHPLVLLSHGSGGNVLQFGWLAEELTRLGFVVAGVNHPGTTSRDSLPARTVMIWERPADLAALLDWFESAPLSGIEVDTQRTGVLGFSLGGHSALALGGLRVSKQRFLDYCARNKGMWDCGWLEAGGVDLAAIDASRYESAMGDPRIRAVVAVDPALSQAADPASLSGLDAPTLIINFADKAGTPEAMDARTLGQALPNATYHTVSGAWHFSMLPECSTMGWIVIGLAGEDNICSDVGLQPRRYVHRAVLAEVMPFLSAKLQRR